MGFGMYGYGQGYFGQGPIFLPVIVGVLPPYITDTQFFFVPAGSHWFAMPTVGRFFLVPVRDPEFMA